MSSDSLLGAFIVGRFELIFLMCSGAFTSLRQHINGLCDVSCQGSSLITRGRLRERERTLLASLLTKELRETNTRSGNNSLSYLWHTKAPDWDSTSHTCSTFSSLKVCLSVWMLPLSRGSETDSVKSALYYSQHFSSL